MDATVKSSFWTDGRVEGSSAEVKLACLWLITNPSRDLCGFTKATIARFCFETNLPPEILHQACEALPTSFQKVGEDSYFAVNFLRHQFGKGGELNIKNKVLLAAARHAEKLPKAMAKVFFSAYPELKNITETIPHPSPSDPPPHGVRVGEGVGEKEILSNLGTISTEWGAVPLTKTDKARIKDDAPIWQSLGADSWDLIHRYMKAKIPKGSGFWQPEMRHKFIETLAAVHQDAIRWERKQGPKPSKRIIPMPQQERTEEDDQAVRDFLLNCKKAIAGQ